MENRSKSYGCEHLGIVTVKQNGKLVIAVQADHVCEWMLSQHFHLSHKQVVEVTDVFCGHRLEPISCFGKDYISLTLILLNITKAALEEKLEISTAVNIIDKFLWDLLMDPSLERQGNREENTEDGKITVTVFAKLSKSKQILGLYCLFNAKVIGQKNDSL